VNVEWDHAKREACYIERGFDFAYVVPCFSDRRRVILRDTRMDGGEERFQMLGQSAGRVFFIAFTMRDQLIRIISARKANQREINRYASQT
jgi:uncharacterized DUF497 family protein